MTEHRGSIDIQAEPDALFAYLSDVSNLPRYFDRMTSARPAEGDRIEVTARLDGVDGAPQGEVEGEAWFRVDQEQHRIEWGSPGPNDYHGWLTVSGGSGSATRLEVGVDTTRAANGEVDDGISQTLDNIKRLVEQANVGQR